MTPRRFRVHSEAYGVRVEVCVEHADNATVQELGRALDIATAQVRDRHEAASTA